MDLPIVVDEIDPRAPDAARLAAWQQLAASAVEPNPFLDPSVAVPAARHLPGGDRVRLLVARDDRRWLACALVTSERAWRRVALPCTVGWLHPYAFLGTPLLCGDAPEHAAEALGTLAARRGRTFLALDQVRADGPVAELLRALRRPATARELYPAERAALRRRPQNDYVDSHRSGKRRREAARLRRRLATVLGDEPRLATRGGDADAVERFLVLEAAGWKGRSGTALASDDAHAAWFRAIAAADHPTLRAELLELGTADRTAAMLFNLVAGDSAYALKLAHDEDLQDGAPGVQLMTEAADWFHEATDAVAYDSCAAPDNPMINALWPDRRTTASFVLTASGIQGAVGRGALRTLVAVQRRRAAAEDAA
ncbi:MAG: GNAT family N-acetyltransferase [Patulibacter sp.]|nr:GNAT family N-acetyltransferase [Patulibacter sp.]